MKEFEHGIDHSGHGVAPLLVIGGPVYESDFELRDLSSIQGVIVKERGVPKGLSWSDLNLRILGDRLKNLKYLNIEYSGRVDLDDFGEQANMTYLYMNCPKMVSQSHQLFSRLVEADILVPDVALRNFLVPSLEKLTIHRPKFQDLTMLSECRSLKSLHIHFARNLTTINGLPDSSRMEILGLHDCPALVHISPQKDMAGPTEMMLGGCRQLVNLSGAECFLRLRKLSLLGAGPEVTIADALKATNIQLEIRGRKVAGN